MPKAHLDCLRKSVVLGEEMENLIYMGEMGWPCCTTDDEYHQRKITQSDGGKDKNT
jgi:hypothetical protein